MTRFRDLYVHPYSGWWEKPWPVAKDITDAVLDRDAAARSARRVTEAVGQALRDLGVEAPRGQYMLDLRAIDADRLTLDLLDRPSDMLIGHLGVPTGFRLLSPAERAAAIGDAVIEAASHLATLFGWDEDAAAHALAAVKDAGFVARAETPWKPTRDRSRRVRLCGEIADDGYLRIVAEIEEGGEVRVTEPVIGWTWLINLERAAKGMRLDGAKTLRFGSGSTTAEFDVLVDLDTGTVTRTPTAPQPLSYPGR